MKKAFIFLAVLASITLAVIFIAPCTLPQAWKQTFQPDGPGTGPEAVRIWRTFVTQFCPTP